MNTEVTVNSASAAKALYRTIWRWHFYAGIGCIPFVIMLACTGAIYLFKPYYESWQESEFRGLVVTDNRLPANIQIAAALGAIDGGKFLSYRLPQAADEAVMVTVQAESAWQVYVNPYTADVLGKIRRDDMLMNVVKTIHGELLIGNLGSLLVELAACWAIVLLVTGLYLWWPRNADGMAGVLYPRLGEGSRTFWRDLHAVTGIWVSAFALFLLVTGLPWATVWGGALKEVRTWNRAQVQQDWTQNRHQEHHQWRVAASDVYDLTSAVLATAVRMELAQPVELSIADAQMVTWKLSSQTQNRPLRNDVWIAADGSPQKQTRFSDKPLLDRAIGVGIAAHEGQLFGWINLLFGLMTCVALILISVSGFILWRKRKPANVLGAPPAMPTRVGLGVVIITLGLAVFMPMMAISLVILLLLEFVVLRRVAALKNWLGLST